MLARTLVTSTVLGAVLGAAPLAAQQDRDGAELVPFTGYMIFGDLLRGPLGTTLSNANASMFGAQAGVPIAGPLSLYVSTAMARSDLTIGAPVFGGLAIGTSKAWLIDGGLELRVPNRAFTPVFQAGAGATHYRIENAFLSTRSTNPSLALGAGLDVALSPSIGLRLMARDYIGRFDFGEATFTDISGRRAHHVGLMAGLRIAF